MIELFAAAIDFALSRPEEVAAALFRHVTLSGAALAIAVGLGVPLGLLAARGLALAESVVTAIGGGLIRDVLAGRQNLLMKRELYAIPVGWEAVTALAIGYAGDNPELPDALRQRDQSVRSRRPLAEFVFGGSWGRAAGALGGTSGLRRGHQT